MMYQRNVFFTSYNPVTKWSGNNLNKEEVFLTNDFGNKFSPQGIIFS
jgi:hypothetical protein